MTMQGTGQQIAVSSVGTGATVAAWLLPAAWAGPIGLAAAGVALALSAIFARKGPQQKVVSTQIVDDLEPVLKANVAGYLDSNRTEADYLAALANFDEAWAYLASAQACGSPELGEPGRRCLADRNRGGQWDWFRRYRDPITAAPPETASVDGANLFSQSPLELLSGNSPAGIGPTAILGAGLLLLGATL